MLPCAYSRGFSLLEVLVAFSITAMALGVMYQIYAKGTTSTILGDEYAEAVLVAESRLALLGTEKEIENDFLNGTELDKYDWQITISDFEHQFEISSEDAIEFDPLINLKKIELEISWTSKGRQRSFVLQTLRPKSINDESD